jgi:hypothetical protein
LARNDNFGFEDDDGNDYNDDDSDAGSGSFNFIRDSGGKCDESVDFINKQFRLLCHGHFQNYQITEKCTIQGIWSCI